MTTTPNLGLTQYAGTDTMNFLTQYNTDLGKIDTTTGKLSNLTTTNKTNLVGATNENVTNIGTLASLKTAVKTSTVGAINEVYDTTDNGWISARATLTYASASAPTFVCNTSINLSTRISVGMKIKLTQTTTKYFFVTAITSTTITLYGGTDYVLANATITNVYYSMVKSPYGFPMNPDKWMVQTIVNTFSQLSANGTFPDIGLTIPIGEWNATVKLTGAVWGNAGYWNGFTVTALDQFRTYGKEIIVSAGDPTVIPNRHSVFMTFNVANTVASNIVLTGVKYSAQTASMEIAGSEAPTILRATCAYL